MSAPPVRARRAVALTALYDDGTETKVDLPSPEDGDVIVLPVKRDGLAGPTTLSPDVREGIRWHDTPSRSIDYRFNADDGPLLVLSMPTRAGHTVVTLTDGQVTCADDTQAALLSGVALAVLDAARARIESGATFTTLGAHP